MFICCFVQARSYIQSLALKPKIPWQRIVGNADPKGTYNVQAFCNPFEPL